MPTKAKGRSRYPNPVGEDGLPRHYTRGFYALGTCDDIWALYPPPYFDSLCNDHKIVDLRHACALSKFLAFAASIYFDAVAKEQRAPGYEIRDRFRRVGKKAAAILDDIRKLDSRFRLAVNYQAETAMRERIESSNQEQTHFSGRATARAHKPVSFRPVTADSLMLALEQVAFVAERYVETFKPGDGGRPSDHALAIWVSNALVFWEVTLGKQFTFDAEKGKEGHTEAYRFCWSAMKPLVPRLTSSALATAMRSAIAQAREAAGKNAPQKPE